MKAVWVVVVVAVAAVLAAVAPAAAQVDEHRNKVIIRSSAADAVYVTGGVATNAIDARAYVSVNALVPLFQMYETDAGADLKFWQFVGSGGTLILRALNDSGSSVSTGIALTRSGANVSQILVGPAGTSAAPAIAFEAAGGTGIYYDSFTPALGMSVGGTVRAAVSSAGMYLPALARGTGGVLGTVFAAGRNTSGNGAPGQIQLEWRTGANASYIWPDTSGVLRTATFGAGEVGGDTGGTIIGTQTSQRSKKTIAGEVTNTAAAMAIVRATPIYQFTYRDGRYNGETFYGITTDDSPLFGMDRGKSFNPVTAFGATVLALRDLDARLAALEARR